MPETVIKKFNEFNPQTGKWEVVERPLVRMARAGRPSEPKAAPPVIDMTGLKTFDLPARPSDK